MSQLLEKYFAVVKNIITLNKSVSCVGLDIGVDSCKLIELIGTDDSFEVLKWGIEPIDGANAQASVQKLFQRLEIHPKNPVTAVFGKGTIIRYIDMPRMPLNDLKKSFDIEADKYFPFSREQIYTDAYILDPKSKEKQMSVLVAAVKKDIINDRIKFLANLGCSANFVGLNAVATANVFNILRPSPVNGVNGVNAEPSSLNPSPPTSVTAILDMGETVSNLSILVNGVPRFTRDIFVGGQDLTKRISSALTISIPEAQKLKCQPNNRIQEIFTICDSVLHNLVSEVKLSFDYFTTERNMHVSKLFLTGGSCLLEGMPDFFTKSLDVTIERWNPFASLKLAGNISSEEIARSACFLTVALGLSLYQYD